MLEQSRLTRDNVTSKREETHRERQTAGTEREREKENPTEAAMTERFSRFVSYEGREPLTLSVPYSR